MTTNQFKEPIQIDPPNCGCTECITGEYRPAVDPAEFENYRDMVEAGYCEICFCWCNCHPCLHTK